MSGQSRAVCSSFCAHSGHMIHHRPRRRREDANSKARRYASRSSSESNSHAWEGCGFDARQASFACFHARNSAKSVIVAAMRKSYFLCIRMHMVMSVGTTTTTAETQEVTTIAIRCSAQSGRLREHTLTPGILVVGGGRLGEREVQLVHREHALVPGEDDLGPEHVIVRDVSQKSDYLADG